MIKVKLKRFLAMTMATLMTLSSNAFATEINLENSSANVNKHGTVTKDSGSDTFDDETTNVWQNGEISEEVRVNVDVASSFTITIPKEIVLNGNDGSATYKVKCEGDIAGDQVICVVPDTSFTLNEDGGKFTNVTVTQNDTDFTYVELNNAKEYDGSLSAPEISAGNWSGSFYFNIEFNDNKLPQKGLLLENYSWDEIAVISEAGKASEYFNIGDEKKLTIEEYNYEDYDEKLGKTVTKTHPETTYHMQILGFNHDDKSDGTGKAGITFGLKECMITTHSMDKADGLYGVGSNIGGWKDCEIRNYVNQNVYNALPQEVKEIIKPVDKLTSKGNTSIEIEKTSDKLFLFSTIEITDTLEDISPGAIHYTPPGEGKVYEYYMKTKDYYKTRNNKPEFWWLRSPDINYTHIFCYIYDGIGQQLTYPIRSVGIVFGFCI